MNNQDGTTEETIRHHAYFLWEQAGRPDGRDSDFWQQARDMINAEADHQTAQRGRECTFTLQTFQPQTVFMVKPIAIRFNVISESPTIPSAAP